MKKSHRLWSFAGAVSLAVVLVAGSMQTADTKPAADADGWISLFDGKSLDGWKAAENPNCAKAVDGVLVVGGGPRGHLFYDGAVKNHDFKNFELKTDVKINPGSNSGIYFHTVFQEKDWPTKGFECQVCSNDYKDPRKTGSLYGVKDLDKSPVADGEWFEYHIIVKGKTVTIKLNGKTVNEWTQADDYKAAGSGGRKLDRGTFALQGHDPKSVVSYRNIRVKPLDD